MKENKPIVPQELVKHETKSHVLIKFLLLLGVLLSYFGWLCWHYGFATGGLVSLLTWSFFVLCTPVADAGFLIDFPIRLMFLIRMWVSEICVWIIALSIAVWTSITNPQVFETTHLTSLFLKIITHPWPFWLIILLSASGTFLSIRFGDELLDCVKHRECFFFHKNHLLHQLIFMLGTIILIFWGYTHLLEKLGVTISLL